MGGGRERQDRLLATECVRCNTPSVRPAAQRRVDRAVSAATLQPARCRVVTGAVVTNVRYLTKLRAEDKQAEAAVGIRAAC